VQPVAVAAPAAPAVAEAEKVQQSPGNHATQRTQRKDPVGVAEDRHFDCDESVTFWKEYRGGKPAVENLREAAEIAASIAAKGANGQQYVLAHGLRTGYMATNAILGTLAFEVSNRIGDLVKADQRWMEADEKGDGGGLLSKGLSPAVDLLGSFVKEAALCFRQDYNSVDSGLFKAPWDMFTPGHRQYTPQYALEKTARFINEAPQTLGRRASEKTPGIWLDSPLYPDYYKNDFHYQTDGWMSPNSAKVYETSTETLFLGRQDAMQRLSLLPLRSVAAARNGAPRILEVACGTGRFATFIRDNHPTANTTLVDLSPFYLEAARENDEYWRKLRYPNENTRPPSANFVQAPAEKLPFEDGSFDAVVNVYLFHEMPEAARAAAAAEMARVVAPGGVVIITDSVQRGDRASMTTEGAKAFGKLNEPHYLNYVDTYIPALFTAEGMECDRKWVESSTKCLSFRKPLPASQGFDGESGQAQEVGAVA
jgi:ubiquinone/menaquinone biosynthesis C-methylase UbiE